MSGVDAFPYPGDEPADIRGLVNVLLGASESLSGAVETVRGGEQTLVDRWSSPSGTLAAGEAFAVAGFGDQAVAALGEAQAPLEAYATALDEARATIDWLRVSYDEAETAYQTELDAIANGEAAGPLVAVARQEALDVRSSQLSYLHWQYENVMAELDAAGVTAGGRLTEIAGWISPAPDSLNGDLAAAEVLTFLPFMTRPTGTSAIRTGDRVIINTGDDNDNVAIVGNAETGGVTVTVNGVAYRFTAEEADDIVVRTGGGEDTIDVDPEMQLGFALPLEAPITVLSGAGNDVLRLSRVQGHNIVLSGDGDDHVDAGAGNDAVDGGAGDDVVLGGSGQDMLTGGAGEDYVDGSTGDDIMTGGGGDDTLYAGEGNDTVDAGTGNDYVDGDRGDDLLSGGDGDDVVLDGSGQDMLTGGAGDDYLDAGGGDDAVDGGEDNDTIYAGEGNDTVDGAAGRDYIDGHGGDDRLSGGVGNDVVSGGPGQDTLTGGGGDDVIYTGADRDSVSDIDGANTVYHQDDDALAVNERTLRVTVEIADIPQTIRVEGSPEFQARVRADLETLAASPIGQQMLQQIGEEGVPRGVDDGHTLTIRESSDEGGYTSVDGNAVTIQYNPWFQMGGSTPITMLFHETVHGYNLMSNSMVGYDAHERWYVGPDAREAPTAMDSDHDYDIDVFDARVALDANNDGRITLDEVDRDDDGDVDDDDIDLNDDGHVDRGDGWFRNGERQAVGLPVDHDSDPSTPDVPASQVVDHPDALTENALRQEMGHPRRNSYR